MTTYYKALRPDGTDFATGTTKPRKGRWMPRIDGELVMCEHGYHVSDAVAETLVGGSWPCKLARVEIPDGEWQHVGHKLLVPTYRVIEWLPAWQALGSNGEEVAAHIERCKRITVEEVQRLFRAGDAAWAAAWIAAWAAAGDAAWIAAWIAAWAAAGDAARDAAGNAAWIAARDAAGNAAWIAAWAAAGDAAWIAAWDAAWAAALGLVVRDVIATEQFDVLYGPWASVMGEAA